MRRMFCAGHLQSLKYGMCEDRVEAKAKLGPDAHLPDPDEMRHIWMAEKLYELDTDGIKAKLGISRQAVSQWRKKAGVDLPNRQAHQRQVRIDRILEVMDESKTAAEIAEEAEASVDEVKDVAQQLGMTLLNKGQKKPEDDEIIRLAKGRTWKELAAACNVTLATLRNYVYARPDLRSKVCEHIVYEAQGNPTHGKIDVDVLLEMYGKGVSAFKIAQHFDTQTIAVIYWLKKLGLYRPEAKSAVS